MKGKHANVVGLLEQRIRDDVQFSALPSERKLASQLGVSYMTARKAVQSLVQKGVLSRQDNGRLTVRATSSSGLAAMNIGFVSPASLSTARAWEYELRETLAARNGTLRPIAYTSAVDPAIFEALDADLDGWFFILPQQAPRLLIDRLRRLRERVVVLWQDTSAFGIPNIETGPPVFVRKLLDHLAGLGHRRIDCLNTQPADPVVLHRIDQWRHGLRLLGLEGELHDLKVHHFHSGAVTARDEVAKLLRSRQITSSALFCVTTSQAWGAMRACVDAGLRIGQDISICGFGESEMARLLIPSVTTVLPADRRPFLDRGLDWIASRGVGWTHPLRIEPQDCALFIGESTGPALY